LLQRLADADELKSIELSRARDEVKNKQRMIDDLLSKSRDVEAQLSKLRIMSFQASELAEKAKALEDLRAQLDERETLLDYQKSKAQVCDDVWLVFRSSSGGQSKKRCSFSFKSLGIRGIFSSMFGECFPSKPKNLTFPKNQNKQKSGKWWQQLWFGWMAAT